MNSGMALKEFCTITNIGSEIFMRLRGEKTLGSGGKIKKNYLSMEFRMIDERNIKWLSLDDIKKYFIFNFCRSRYTNPTTIKTIKEAENLIFKNGNLINKTIEYILKQDLKSGFISKIDNLNLYIELLRKKSSINMSINSKDIFNLEAPLEFTSFINDSIESQKNNSIKKEKNYRIDSLEKIFLNNYSKNKGFLPLQHPTGNGKTYQLEKFCATILESYMTDENTAGKKIIILTNNKININSIRKGILSRLKERNCENLNINIINILSRTDILKEGIVFKEILYSLNHNEKFFTLLNSNTLKLEKVKKIISYCLTQVNQNSNFDFYGYTSESINMLKDYLIHYLKKVERLKKSNHISDKVELEKLQNTKIPNFYVTLFPMIIPENQNKKIYIMTTDKFLYGYFTGIKNEYFYNQKNNLIIIDEIDSAKSNFLKYIKENKTLHVNGIIEKFNNRFNSFSREDNNFFELIIEELEKEHHLSSEKISSLKSLVSNYIKSGNELREKYSTTSKYFQLDRIQSIDLFQKKEDFILKDGSKLYLNKSNRYWTINPTISDLELSSTIEDLYKHSHDELYNLFKAFNIRLDECSEASSDVKLQEVINHFFFDDNINKDIFKEYNDFYSYQVKNISQNLTYGVRLNGCKYINIHEANTEWDYNNRAILNYYHMFMTPESLLLLICQNNLLYGISATACSDTIIGNFDLSWLKRFLKTDFIELNSEEKAILREELNFINSFENKVERTLNVYSEDDIWSFNKLKGFENIKKKLKEKEYLEILELITNLIDSEGDAILFKYSEDYIFYGALVFLNFILDNTTSSLLFLSNRFSAIGTLEKIAIAIGKKLKKEIWFKSFNSAELEKSLADKNSELLTNLKFMNKKVIIFSSLQSAGVGVNIKFEYEGKPHSKKLVKIDNKARKYYEFNLNMKDIDEIAIENKTNLAEFDESFNQDKLTLLYYINMLEESKIICEKTSARLLNSFSKKIFTKFYKSSNDYVENASSWIIQAIGRCNRTKVRCVKRNIYLDFDAAKVLSQFNLNGRDTVQDFKFIKQQLESNFSLTNQYTKNINSMLERKNKIIQNYFDSQFLEKIQEYNNLIIYPKENLDSKAIQNLKELYEKYENFRAHILKYPTKEYSENHLAYFDYKDKISGYLAIFNDENSLLSLDFSKSTTHSVSKDECRLSLLKEIDELKSLLNEKVGNFDENYSIILPYIYQAIFKGKLGEVIIRRLLENYTLQFKSSETIVSKGLVEIFDDITSSGHYIDYKNFNLDKFNYRDLLAKEITNRVQIKSKYINFHNKLFIINLISPISENNLQSFSYYKTTLTKDGELTPSENFEDSEVIVVSGVINYSKEDKDKLEINHDVLYKLVKLLEGGDRNE
ncbi:hypothetical protein [Cetobacterium sp.]|uniref:hypothetical protein n=1 Tax=Cetobacterium sp. TaxID=2071632 RepID=UPI003F41897E